ncbi:MAG: hypothetical protein WKF71_14705 [Pyrinomonadaceae bacterium]
MFDPRSNFDVLLFGTDGPKFKVQSSRFKVQSSKSKIQNPKLDLRLETALNQAENVRRSSLERIGFYAENLAASNNWVVSGKKLWTANRFLPTTRICRQINRQSGIW